MSTTFLSTLITAGSIVLGGSLLIGQDTSTYPQGTEVTSPSNSSTTPPLAPKSEIAPGSEAIAENSDQAARDKYYLDENPGMKIEDSTEEARNQFYFEKHPGEKVEDSTQVNQEARDKVYLEAHPGETIEDSTVEARNKFYFDEHPTEMISTD